MALGRRTEEALVAANVRSLLFSGDRQDDGRHQEVSRFSGAWMARSPKKRPAKDPSAGGKRSAMPADERAAGAPLETSSDGPRFEGLRVLADIVPTLPAGPGVYRMLNRRGEALYVGKAKSLKRRVSSYTQLSRLPRRLQRMVAETAGLEVVETASEVEALLLESNLIKRLMPRYNVLLRDDKSFPYILITGDHRTPQITKHRGARSREGDYFGPFASAGAVNRTITALERAFLLRSCSDAVFAGRHRPCLLFQIKRCSAPCVGKISDDDYQALVDQAFAFLKGEAASLQHGMARAMEEASARLDFESAAVYRDRIKALAHILSRQDINVEGIDDADVIAADQRAGRTCVQVFFFRAGRNYGNRAYFPSHDKAMPRARVLAAFVAQFYDNKPPPKLILLSEPIEESDLLAEALSLNAGVKVRLLVPRRGTKKSLVDNARRNAQDALARRLSESENQRALYERMAETFALEAPPERVEVYDNSHIQGTNPYGAMVVAGPEGFNKQAYRKFSIKTRATGGEKAAADAETRSADDYAMMREVLTRRLSRALKEDPERATGAWPDLIILDGGKCQLAVGCEVLAELGLSDIPIIAVAKGPERNAGRERIFQPDRPALLLAPRDPLLYLIQRLRDEAHRFAIGAHRLGRKKSRLTSALDQVPGIGAKRKRALLLHFGSATAVARAGMADLEAVEGISKTVARKIYDHFNA
jgi:excinuclease ABC subunit C